MKRNSQNQPSYDEKKTGLSRRELLAAGLALPESNFLGITHSVEASTATSGAFRTTKSGYTSAPRVVP